MTLITQIGGAALLKQHSIVFPTIIREFSTGVIGIIIVGMVIVSTS